MTAPILHPLDEAACRALLDGVTEGIAADAADPVRWLLATMEDGIVWGRRQPGQAWQLSTAAHPDCSPPLRLEALLELRTFDGSAETLVWRHDDALAGRRFSGGDGDDVRDRRMLLLGRPLRDDGDGAFVLFGDRAGSRHSPPRDATGRIPRWLHVRDLLEVDDESGVARVAATWCLAITGEERR